MLRSKSLRVGRAIIAAINGIVPEIDRYQSAAAGQQPLIFEPLESRRLLSVSVTTYHYDNSRDGANTKETALTLSNVNTTTFGKVASFPVDAQVYAQPLVMANVAVSGQGTHDIVLVATENDTVYAFDAEGNNPAPGYLWKTSLLQTGETAVPQTDYATTDITPLIGITGTPVVDPSTGTMYVVGAFKESNGTYQQRLYALDITSGAAKFGGPVTIAATVAGTGYQNVNGQESFSPFWENQRPALTLANGEVYIAWSAHGDLNPWHGWVITYNAATLRQDYVYCDTANGDAGGIWMSGGGLAVDSSGNLYFTSGNGTFDANTAGGDYGMTLEKVSPSLTPEDYFAPYNQSSLSNDDLDYGCSSVILLPTQSGTYPDEMLSLGKWGTIYLNDSDTGKLGEYNANGTGPNDDLGEANVASNTTTSDMHNTISYWNGHVYVGGDGLKLQAFNVGNGALSTTAFTQSTNAFGSTSATDGQGCGPTISSNGSSNGIVWALDNSGFNKNPAVLYAYNASNLSQTLWSSSQAANGRDTCGDAVKFQDAVVANGYVYVGGAGTVTVYGLLSNSTATPTLVTPAAASPSTVANNTTALSVLATDPSPDLHPVYSWAATTIPTGATAPTFSINQTNAANNPTVIFSHAGTYTFTVTIEDPNSALTITSSVNVTVQQTLTSLAIAPSTATIYDSGTQQFTATTKDQFGGAMSSQPTFAWSVASGGAGGLISSTGLYSAPPSGIGTDTIKVTGSSLTATASITVTPPSGTVEANLTSSENKVGIVADGTTFTGGIDGGGSALSGTLLGTILNWNGSAFGIPPTTPANTTNNVIYGTGQTISLPQDRYSTIKLLALHIDGDVTGVKLTVTYTDGTTTTLTQSFSDWYTPQNYSGESEAVIMPYRDEDDGTQDDRTFYVYGYSFTLNGAKTVKSITLPNDNNLIVLSIDLINAAVSTAASANPTTITGTTTALSVLGSDPSGDANPTYTWITTSMPAGAQAPTFSINGTSAANNSTATVHMAGSYTFTAEIFDSTSGLYATSSVSVTVNQTLTQITVTPAGPVSIPNGQTQQFSATALDQFGQKLSAQPTFTWSETGSGGGSVSSSGLYQAPPTGTGSATVQAASAGVSGQATVQVTLPAWLGAGSIASWNSSTKILTVTGATSIIADPGTDEPVIQANNSSGVITINPPSSLLIHIGGLSLTNAASAIVTSLGAARTATNHRDLIVGTTAAPLFNIDASSKLDLTDNDMDVANGSLATINSDITLKYDYGTWAGTGGITSTIAAANTTHLTTLGAIQNNGSGTALFNSSNLFDGTVPGASDILMRYTYYGDANLDGRSDGSDYTLIDNGFNHRSTLTGWYNGDFNYDGLIDGSDYTLIDNAFNVQKAALSTKLGTIAIDTAADVITDPIFAGKAGTEWLSSNVGIAKHSVSAAANPTIMTPPCFSAVSKHPAATAGVFNTSSWAEQDDVLNSRKHLAAKRLFPSTSLNSLADFEWLNGGTTVKTDRVV